MPPRSPAQRAAIRRSQERRALAPERSILASVSLSAAQREQGEVSILDLVLADRARLRHPAVRWWWGPRDRDGRHGALCYLCDQLIVSWHRAYPMPRSAVAAVLEHRDSVHEAGS